MDENISAQSTESTSDHPVAGQTTAIQPIADPAVRFRGLGTNFRAKLIGIDDVQDSRGDQMCQESILKLKAAVLASGRHKQKVIINVSLEGIKIVDVLTGEVQHVHPVHRISFIARDLTDRRAFGYVYGVGEGKHQFFGIKTAKVAEVLVLALRDLFQVVYDMKKKEIEDVKSGKIVVNGQEKTAENHPVLPTPSQEKQQTDPHAYQQSQPAKDDGNILNLEQQLTTIQEGINNIDAIGPWSQDLPTSPDTPGDMGGDLFGMASNSTNGASKQTSSYSDELFDLASPVAQPAPQPGAKLTREQILSGFGSAQQQSTFPAQAGMYMMPPNQMQYQYNQGQVQPQQQMFAVPQASPPIGMFPPGPGPAIPPRPGAMKPPGSQPLPGGAPQNPFGDSGLSQTAPMLAPNVGPSNNQAVNEAPKPSDPFASLVPGMGDPVPNKKDMFKNFQMAKPPQPPPRTNPPVNISQNDQPAMEQPSNFENYFLNSVGGVPIADDAANNNPAPAPRKQVNANDAFGIGADAFSQPAAGNAFASDQAFSQPFDFNQGGNNSQSLFG